MGSSTQRDKQLRCQVRNEWIAATPEEHVRQKLIVHLINNLKFPKELITVEKGLSALDRRTDILCYINDQNTLKPLLLIECKATKINQKVFKQAQGYNSHIQAPYVAVANDTEIQMGWFEGDEFVYVPYIPMWQQLGGGR